MEEIETDIWISIHAPRGGSDVFLVWGRSKNFSNFNPRSPWGERRSGVRILLFEHDFNPRSPWGERRCRCLCPGRSAGFQSTLPVGGATRLFWHPEDRTRISIHAPRGGSDRRRPGSSDVTRISIHAPRGGSDSKYAQIHCLYCAERICFLQIILPFL